MQNEISGRSVYEGADPNLPLYRCARELIVKCYPDVVLEIGCSDLICTGPLAETYTIIGMDLSSPPLHSAKNNYQGASLFQADANSLPVNLVALAEGRRVGVVMLEVLEHLRREETIYLLNELRHGLGQNHFLIVSMPIISPTNIATAKEFLLNLVKYRGHFRSPTGLFDRTHQILTDRSGHREIFGSGGYEIEQDGVKLWKLGITGEWDWMKAINSSGEDFTDDWFHRLASMLIFNVTPSVGNRLTHIEKEGIIKELMGFQAIYLLNPKTSRDQT